MNWTRKLYPLAVTALQTSNGLLSSFPRIASSTHHSITLVQPHNGRLIAATRNFATATDNANNRPTLPPGTPHKKPSTSSSLTALPIKKRPAKKTPTSAPTAAGFYNVVAYATAEEYDLERLRRSLIRENLYQLHELPQPATEPDHSAAQPATAPEDNDYLYVSARIQIGDEPREIFFFRAGSVVLWNCSELECSNVLAQLKHCELDSYDRRLVEDERDCMAYRCDAHRARLANGNFLVSGGVDAALEKYTFANALSTSVKLGIWEAALDRYVDSMAYVTADLKRGAKIRMSRAEVLRKTGELFALRHMINLSSDLLDTPDFYWDREQLEGLYSSACGHFSVQRRTKVMNEKLNHCIELADLVASNLNDIHHVRLEWMIIVLIMVEVAFEMIHLLDRFM